MSIPEEPVEAAAQNIFDALSRLGFEEADIHIADELAAYRAAVERAAAAKQRANVEAHRKVRGENHWDVDQVDRARMLISLIDPDGE